MDLFSEIIFHDALYFLKGFVAGFAVSLPLGPAALLCVNQTLRRGFFRGLAAGVGIATADAFYGGVVSLGLTSLSDFIFAWFNRWRFIGGLFLLVLGVSIYILKPAAEKPARNDQNLIHIFFSTFGIALANPLVLLLFAAIFAVLGLDNRSYDWDHMGFLILGIFSGAFFWWVCLCSALSLLHGKATLTSLSWTNKALGLMIVGFGVYTLYGTF